MLLKHVTWDLPKLVMSCRRSSPDGRALLKVKVLEIGRYIAPRGLRLFKLHSGGASITSMRFVSPWRVSSSAKERHVTVLLPFCAEQGQVTWSTQLLAVFATTAARPIRLHQVHLQSAEHNGRWHRLCVLIAAATTTLCQAIPVQHL